ncbi:MAG: DEAD/DEAH box helicase [Pirellulaceae bacterium]|nr:DEAD/DEAH box helicase [Pirellulaceae bacterium]
MPTPPPKNSTTFDSLGLSDVMLDALDEAGYEYPTPVQAGLIPRALQGIDVVGQARTGTGKTASFVIPILETLQLKSDIHHPQALVMVPTRELAVQVRDEAVKLSFGRRVHVVAVYGGKPIRDQIEKIRKGAQIIVGTPGRVLDHLARGTIDFTKLKMVVLDEADRMLDIGFRPDIERILKRCPSERQTLLLSATVPPPIAKLAERYMRSPETLNFSSKDLAVETIEQFYFTVDPQRKFDLLLRLLHRENPRQAIIFCRTKRGTDKIYLRLSKKSKEVACIHGDMNQGARDRVMESFRSGRVRILVATDVIGRGIDVSTISHIINYDIPAFCDDYVHRVGRTGRMGREGVAFTFVAPDEGPELTRIEERINRLLKRDEMKDFDPRARENAAAGAMPERPHDGGQQPSEGAPAAAPAPPPPPTSLMRRPPKRYKRAL